MRLSELGQALPTREILELVHDDLRKVEREIARESVASVDAVTNIGQYLQSSGGKRLRPMLVLLASKLVGETDDKAISLAAIAEMILPAPAGGALGGAGRTFARTRK